MEGVDQIFEYLRTAGTLGLLGLATKFYVDLRTLKANNRAAERTADLKLDEQRDGLTFDLLEAARKDLADLRLELARIRPTGDPLRHFETALEHVEALLGADDETRAGLERSARAFLNRIRRLQRAHGTLTNEVQRIDSSVSVAERSVGDGPAIE